MNKPGFLKLALIIFGSLLLILIIVFLIRHYMMPTAEIERVSENKVLPVSNKKNEPVLNDKTAKDARLQAQADALLTLFDNMPSVPLFVRDEPILTKGSETERRAAYTICEPGNKPTIFFKKIYYEKANQKQLTNSLKHELTHAWFCRQGIQAGHDERWRKKFTSIGGFGN